MARRKKTVEPKYEVELVLGQRKTGMMLPRNTGNWFASRIFADAEEIGIVEVGRGSVPQPPLRHRLPPVLGGFRVAHGDGGSSRDLRSRA